MRLTYLVLHVHCGCNKGLSIYSSLLPPGQVSRLLCSHRGTLAQSASVDDVASDWYTKLRQVGHTNHRPFSLRLCDLQGQRYCKSLVQLYVARQPAVNKRQCNTLYLSRSAPTFCTRLFIWWYHYMSSM